ncbi:TrkA family potassium uptake protein [Bremerella cremea]|uniref:TrkA family potassium uptake protein n=1 Tax=Bremerella cremea TaxID=1031537 RepID=A0A368KTK7_9BACT|nr:TrkA family potassium uptake protein [Bremerella cremea]RCS53007.1 TrkA family potassium uptake protein [Bremerella cremea]
MPPVKHFYILGLGSFGSALAKRLKKNGCRVTGVDLSRENVEEIKDDLYEAIIADATEHEALQHLNLKEANGVFISMGEDITPSLLATLHAKELGARRIIVKGVTKDHGKLLKSLGVERVIFPEAEIAETLADRMTWPNIIDYLPIDPEYSFMEVAVPDDMVGKSLMNLNLRQQYGVWVVGVKDPMTGKLAMFPDGGYSLGLDQLLLVVGKQTSLEHLRNQT